ALARGGDRGRAVARAGTDSRSSDVPSAPGSRVAPHTSSMGLSYPRRTRRRPRRAGKTAVGMVAVVVEQTVAETPQETAERKAARNGTVAERDAYAVRRREANAARDADRVRLAAELARRSKLTIRHERGYLSVPPGTLDPAVAAIVEHAGTLIDSIGHDALFERGSK